MIQLTKLNGTPMVLNSDLVKTVEASPDTMLTLINGEKLMVRESIDAVVDAVLHYRGRLLASVASRVPDIGNLARATSLASLDLAQQRDRSSAVSAKSSGQRSA